MILYESIWHYWIYVIGYSLKMNNMISRDVPKRWIHIVCNIYDSIIKDNVCYAQNW